MIFNTPEVMTKIVYGIKEILFPICILVLSLGGIIQVILFLHKFIIHKRCTYVKNVQMRILSCIGIIVVRTLLFTSIAACTQEVRLLLQLPIAIILGAKVTQKQHVHPLQATAPWVAVKVISSFTLGLPKTINSSVITSCALF